MINGLETMALYAVKGLGKGIKPPAKAIGKGISATAAVAAMGTAAVAKPVSRALMTAARPVASATESVARTVLRGPMTDVTGEVMSGAGSIAAKALFKKAPDGPAAGNFFTGHRLRTGANWGLGIGMAGVGAGAAVYGYHKSETWGYGEAFDTKTMGQVVYSGNLQPLAYDGSANLNSATGRYDLGATGDLVLAMNANRRSR